MVQPAAAADLGMPIKAPPVAPVPAYNWSGFYIGGNFGGGWGHIDRSVFDQAGIDTGVPEFTGGFDTSGFFGGGQIGFNYMFLPYVLVGVEADGEWSNIKGTGTGCTIAGCSSGASTLNDFGTVRGRLGFVWNNWLFYGTGGLAWSDSTTDRTIDCVGALCPAVNRGGAVATALTGQSATVSGSPPGWDAQSRIPASAI
jgi:outer membrane immunogenic protein